MRLLTIAIFLLISFFAHAQHINYKQIIPPADSVDLPLEEKLVRIAWQNYPQNKVLQHKLQQAQEQHRLARNSWKESLNFNTQYSIGRGPDTLNAPLPGNQNNNTNTGFGVGLSINLGALFNNKIRARAAMEDVKIAEETLNLQKLMIRSEVLTRYQAYLSAITILRVRTQSAEEAYGAYLLAEERYKNGESTYPEYNQAYLVHTNAVEAKAEYESKVLLAKIALEEIIGVPLEQVQ
ncbi:MAG: hypothetical protein D6730_10760 [Bacteroidetes bacterium]|nr:MAG: hypothetical protein D6730_10760 [Bacteroidota bacterium]